MTSLTGTGSDRIHLALADHSDGVSPEPSVWQPLAWVTPVGSRVEQLHQTAPPALSPLVK